MRVAEGFETRVRAALAGFEEECVELAAASIRAGIEFDIDASRNRVRAAAVAKILLGHRNLLRKSARDTRDIVAGLMDSERALAYAEVK